MTKQFNDGTRDCQNLGPFSSGAEAIWSLAKLVVNHGWVLVDSDDGSGTLIDMVTYQGKTSGGLDRTNAWLELEDPGSRRQFLFIRTATGHYSWHPLYSASGAYPVAVHPNPPAAAADEVNLYLATGRANPPGDSLQRPTAGYSLFPNPMNHRVHCCMDDAVASDTDVYSFWMFLVGVGTGVETTTMVCTARVGEGGLAIPGSADSAVFYCHYNPPIVNYLSASGGFTINGMFGGFYGGEFDAFTVRRRVVSNGELEPAAGVGANAENARQPLLPMEIFRSAAYGAVPGDAGVLEPADIHWVPNRAIFVYGAYFDDEAYAGFPGPDHLYVVDQDVVLTGWFSNVVDPTV